MKLKKPTSHITEVLYTLIKDGKASIKEFYWMSGFRTRISDLKLKYGIDLNVSIVESSSKYGNKSSYSLHSLPGESKEKAIKIYNKLIK